MALLTPQQVTITGATITPVAANLSDTVKPDDRVFLEYENTNAATRDVTVVVPGSKFGQPLADVLKTIPATNGRVRLGPMTADLADPDTGLITVNLSATAGVTVAAIRV